jgi:hypothetical protein
MHAHAAIRLPGDGRGKLSLPRPCGSRRFTGVSAQALQPQSAGPGRIHVAYQYVVGALEDALLE